MRDPIVAIALAGTSRQEQVNFITGTPMDALLTELPEGEVERTFLLSAGAWAIYRQAGTQAQQSTETCTTAGAETLRECSLETALLVSRLLAGDQSALLPEALERLHQQGLRLPFRLLPLALNVTGKETRAAIFPLLGERGRWLSQFNPAWKWVNNYLAADEESLPAGAETIWQEGTSGQRAEILRRLRAVDPDKARAWLEAVWKQEKADARSEFVSVLEIGLCAADEPFLERVLDDRAGGVRATAANLLARLPKSALSERMRQRGQSMLAMVDGRVRITAPTELAKEWQRDGIAETPPRQVSQRAWWLFQILVTIEPTFWETYLGASPAELLALLPAHDGWRTQIIEGWSRAAMNFRAEGWLQSLWSWWYEHYQEIREKEVLIEYSYPEQFLPSMSGPIAERIVLSLIEKGNGDQFLNWSNLLFQLPRPWSVEFAQTYLSLFRERCTVESMQTDTFNPYNNPWLQNLPTVALALPVACFDEATRAWDFPEDGKWHIQHARQQIQEFANTIHTRQKIDEEII
ncbi:MAG TPA: DUF5691 domain-containing protein [Ktedonobacteraceae bacterium]|nr:DUF5691 domain-containing protein [Ktedonobacteraceae bacterium]